MGANVGKVAEVGKATCGLGGDTYGFVPKSEIESQVTGQAVIVCDVYAKDGLTQVARADTLSEGRVEAGWTVGEKCLQAREDVLSIRVGGAELIVLQTLERKAHLERMLALSEVDVVVELIGIEVEDKLASGMETTLEVGDATNVDKAYG